MDNATTKQPSKGKGTNTNKVSKRKVAPRKGGYFFAQKF